MLLSLKKLFANFITILLLLCTTGVVHAQIYTNDFEGGGIGGTSFTGGATGDPNLGIAASVWSTDGAFTTFVGTAPTPATSMALQPGTATTTTWTLNVPVNTGYSANITGLELDYRSTSTSYDFLTITINGTAVYAGSVLTDASFHHLSFTGLSVTGITGAISMVSVMSGGSHGGSSTFRYDNVSLIGTVVPANHAPSFAGGTSQSLSVCANSTASINSLLGVNDIDAGQTETWTVSGAPLHGTLSGFSTTAAATGGTVLPGGTLVYTPNPGYSGSDIFTIQVSDGFSTATTTVNVTVNPAPASITGITGICPGTTTTLNSATIGGTWSSSDITIADVDPFSGVVTGISSGMAAITYTDGSTGCITTINMTVNPGPAPIAGPTGVCAGAIINLTNTVPGGVWSSSNIAVGSVNTSGNVTGISSGTATISYTLGICAVTKVVTVTTLAPITGGTTVCAGMTIALSDATPGGVWSSANTLAATVSPAGIVSGVVSGSAAIYYSVGACYVSIFVTVGNPVAPINGADSVCSGAAIGLNSTTPGGAWASSNTAVATVSGGGNVRGVTQGIVTISYSVGGCTETHQVVIKAGNAGTIVGKDSLCKGPGNTIILSNAVTGGVWSSSNTSRATVDPVTGLVTGKNTGIDTIRYTISNTCGTFKAKKVIYIRTPAKCATGIDDETMASGAEFTVFPNPNNGTFTIKGLLGDQNEEVYISVMDMLGKAVYTNTVLVRNGTLDEQIQVNSALPGGMYLLSLRSPSVNKVLHIILQR